jgi:N6-adenosine-specific RNA methylase IME4
MKTETDYLQDSLHSFNLDHKNWYGWRKVDDDGNKIPNNQRMTYEHTIVIAEGATKPSEVDVNAKIQEIKDADTAITNARTSGKAKLKAGDALTDAEISALFGD